MNKKKHKNIFRSSLIIRHLYWFAIKKFVHLYQFSYTTFLTSSTITTNTIIKLTHTWTTKNSQCSHNIENHNTTPSKFTYFSLNLTCLLSILFSYFQCSNKFVLLLQTLKNMNSPHNTLYPSVSWSQPRQNSPLVQNWCYPKNRLTLTQPKHWSDSTSSI